MIYTVPHGKGIIKIVPTLSWIPNILPTFSIWWLISHINLAVIRCYEGVFHVWLRLSFTDHFP